MKSIILAITLTVFTLGAFAGEACCPKEKATAAAKNTTACSATAKLACAEKAATAACPMAKGKCAHLAAKKVQSPKAASQS
jgi:hypothetical protein